MTYFQDTEFALLRELLTRLPDRTALDVGAEKGSFVDTCLAAGSTRVFAFEPYPPHVARLRQRFADVPAVTVFDVAIGETNGAMPLHVAHDAAGQPLDYHHSLVEFGDGHTVRWSTTIDIQCRSLDSMAADGLIPRRVGLLKIDTEGADLLVLRGAASIESAVIAVECWKGLDDTIGHCPYEASEVVALLASRGYRDFVLVKRHDEFEVVQAGSAHMRDGDWGNLVFVHEAVRDDLAAILYRESAAASERLVDRALWFRSECQQRMAVIESLDSALSAVENASVVGRARRLAHRLLRNLRPTH